MKVTLSIRTLITSPSTKVLGSVKDSLCAVATTGVDCEETIVPEAASVSEYAIASVPTWAVWRVKFTNAPLPLVTSVPFAASDMPESQRSNAATVALFALETSTLAALSLQS